MHQTKRYNKESQCRIEEYLSRHRLTVVDDAWSNAPRHAGYGHSPKWLHPYPIRPQNREFIFPRDPLLVFEASGLVVCQFRGAWLEIQWDLKGDMPFLVCWGLAACDLTARR